MVTFKTETQTMNEYLNIILRSLAVYLFMVAAIRLTGRKELSQLNTSDVVLILLISNAVQNAMVGPDTSLLGGLLAAAALFLVNFVLKKFLYRSQKLRNLILQKPEILIHDGKVDEAALHKLDLSMDELQEAMREHGVEEFYRVKLAMFEMDGTISIVTDDEKLRRTVHKRKRVQRNMIRF